MDPRGLTDEELDQLRRDLAAECERRQRLASIPAQIEALKQQYIEDGGDPASVASVGDE